MKSLEEVSFVGESQAVVKLARIEISRSGLLLVAEFSLVLWLRGLTFRDYLASRDPVAGTVYIVMLGLFAIMPLLVART